MIDDAAEFFFFFPRSQYLYDTVNAIAWNKVLGVAFLKNLAGVHEEYLALPGGRLVLVEENYNSRGCGVVEQVFGQVEDVFDKVVVNKPLSGVFLLICADIA